VWYFYGKCVEPVARVVLAGHVQYVLNPHTASSIYEHYTGSRPDDPPRLHRSVLGVLCESLTVNSWIGAVIGSFSRLISSFAENGMVRFGKLSQYL
jgi:hypothetical protein